MEYPEVPFKVVPVGLLSTESPPVNPTSFYKVQCNTYSSYNNPPQASRMLGSTTTWRNLSVAQAQSLTQIHNEFLAVVSTEVVRFRSEHPQGDYPDLLLSLPRIYTVMKWRFPTCPLHLLQLFLRSSDQTSIPIGEATRYAWLFSLRYSHMITFNVSGETPRQGDKVCIYPRYCSPFFACLKEFPSVRESVEYEINPPVPWLHWDGRALSGTIPITGCKDVRSSRIYVRAIVQLTTPFTGQLTLRKSFQAYVVLDVHPPRSDLAVRAKKKRWPREALRSYL